MIVFVLRHKRSLEIHLHFVKLIGKELFDIIISVASVNIRFNHISLCLFYLFQSPFCSLQKKSILYLFLCNFVISCVEFPSTYRFQHLDTVNKRIFLIYSGRGESCEFCLVSQESNIKILQYSTLVAILSFHIIK